MKLSIGIVGLPNVGKSTLFKILTKQPVNIANYPFCTIDPNVGVVSVPDERLDKLAAMNTSAKKIPAVVEFYDIAGLVKGAAEGEGLGNQFLSHIKEVQAIALVLRCFPSTDIIHVENSVDSVRDLEIVNTELILKDLESVERRLKKEESEAKTGKKEAVRNFDVLTRIKGKLQKGELLTEFVDEPLLRDMPLLAAKKQLYVLNGRPEDVSQKLQERIQQMGGEVIVADFSTASEIPELIQAAYRTLTLMSFFTTGEDESRAWTIPRHTKAPQAAGVIHTDFEKKFIRAEVVNWQKLLAAGSWVKAQSQGLIRTEGKDYILEDGDVIIVRHAR